MNGHNIFKGVCRREFHRLRDAEPGKAAGTIAVDMAGWNIMGSRTGRVCRPRTLDT